VPALVVVVDSVVVVPLAESLVVVVVVSWATTVAIANMQPAPAATTFVNLVGFMFVLCFVKRMLPVVTNWFSDASPTVFIQSQRLFVNCGAVGRIPRRPRVIIVPS